MSEVFEDHVHVFQALFFCNASNEAIKRLRVLMTGSILIPRELIWIGKAVPSSLLHCEKSAFGLYV